MSQIIQTTKEKAYFTENFIACEHATSGIFEDLTIDFNAERKVCLFVTGCLPYHMGLRHTCTLNCQVSSKK